MAEYPDMRERMMRVETIQAQHSSFIEETMQTFKEINDKLGNIERVIAGNKGFWAGVIFAFSALTTAVGTGIGFMLHSVWPGGKS